jgi:sulfur carrier protein ThiS
MRVTLEFVGIRLGGLKSGDDVEVSPETTIADLLFRHGAPEQDRALVLPLVNGKLEAGSYVLEQGDRLKLFLPVAGG